MKAEYQTHIDALTAQFHVHQLTEEEYMDDAIRSWNFTALSTIQSFSAKRDSTGEYVLWVEKDCSGDFENQCAYFTALHELGHIALGHIEMDKEKCTRDQITDKEIAAWEWAFSKTIEWPNDRTIVSMLDSLSTYSDNAAGLFDKPPDPAYLQQLAEEIENPFEVLTRLLDTQD